MKLTGTEGVFNNEISSSQMMLHENEESIQTNAEDRITEREDSGKDNSEISTSAKTFKSVGEFLEKELKVSYLVEPLVVSNQINMIVGSSGSLKTTFSLCMVRCCLRQEKFLDMETRKLDSAIYINRDDPGCIIQDQLRRLGFNQNDKLFLWDLSDDQEPPRLDDACQIDEYMIAAKKFPLMIFDALAMFSSEKDENTVKDMSVIMSVLRKLCNLTTVILIHHAGKSQGSKIFRGSTHILDSAHVLLNLERVGDERVRLYCRKSKVAPIPKDKFLKIKYNHSDTSFNAEGWVTDDDEKLEVIRRIIERMESPSQSGIIDESPFSKIQSIHLLDIGEGKKWNKRKAEKKKFIYDVINTEDI